MIDHGLVRRAGGSGRGWWRLAAALALAALSGGVCAYLGLPLPWLLGALAGTTALSIGGFTFEVPPRLRQSMIGVVGVMLGSTFTPDRLSAGIDWLPSLAALPVYILLVGVTVYTYLLWRSRLDRTSVFFAAAPGGLSEMIALSDQMGGDIRSVTLVHAARLVLIMLAIPLLATVAGLDAPADAPGGPPVPLTPIDLLVLFGLAVAGYALALRLRLPAAPFLGPLAGSTLAHLTDWSRRHRPTPCSRSPSSSSALPSASASRACRLA